MNLPTTEPNGRDLAWYIRECEDLRNRLESLAKSDQKQTDDYVCVDRERGLYRRASHARDAVSADRLALALSLETIDDIERENAALREDRARLEYLTHSLGWIVVGWPEMDPSDYATEEGTLTDFWIAAIDAARAKEGKL